MTMLETTKPVWTACIAAAAAFALVESLLLLMRLLTHGQLQGFNSIIPYAALTLLMLVLAAFVHLPLGLVLAIVILAVPSSRHRATTLALAFATCSTLILARAMLELSGATVSKAETAPDPFTWASLKADWAIYVASAAGGILGATRLSFPASK